MKIGVAKNKKKIFVSLYKKNIELHPLWLRERVNNQELLDQSTGQRLYDPSDLNQRLKIKRALIKNKSLSVEFSDGIESVYQIEDLINEITPVGKEIQKLLEDKPSTPGSVKNRKNTAPEKGKTTLLEVKNA